ncbi:nuclear transport factor 2 family protein [Chryseobacterium sp. LAM-KRS1]|uniref:nuclear transport factor 2 family protein n=1 Tax=Chryseobacterium sp. LAM-KRS1 TaxID=2715754 RepID=UPI0015516AFA|nr:nuclear transport factor 2 family protein [Chryseobacterium sp. LAM-KRS1]
MKYTLVFMISLSSLIISGQKKQNREMIYSKSTVIKKQPSIEKILSAIDSKDPNKFAEFLSEDSVFKFGNFPEEVGKSAIFKAQTDFYNSIKDLKHKILRIWKDSTSTVVQMEVSYTRHDGSNITLPVTDVFVFDGNKITHTLIYMDINPLYNKGN